MSLESSNERTKSPARNAFWALGFRPFFLLGTGYGALSLAIWIWAYSRGLGNPRVDLLWHAHEMIFGFAVAIVVGFLYTSSQTWTGLRGIHGMKLIVVVALWVAGRIVFLLPNVSQASVAIVDLGFLPLAVGLLASYLVRAGQRRNVGFLAILLVLWLSNLAYHLDLLGVWSGVARKSLYFATHLIILTIVIIGGRVIPFFSSRAIVGYIRRDVKVVDNTAIAAVICYMLVHAWDETSTVTVLIAALAGTLNLVRMIIWYDHRIWKIPILWILYVGYAWIVVGFLGSALAGMGMFPASNAAHAFTAGAMGTMIVGMVSRVSLGHTARKIEASRWTVAAYVAVTIGSGLRVFGPLLAPAYYIKMVTFSGAFWILSLLILVGVYFPVLLKPRVDGKPG